MISDDERLAYTLSIHIYNLLAFSIMYNSYGFSQERKPNVKGILRTGYYDLYGVFHADFTVPGDDEGRRRIW